MGLGPEEHRSSAPGGSITPSVPVTVFGGRSAALIIVLMMASQVLNQVDRAVLAVAAPDIMRDLGVSAEQYGLLASAFYLLHSGAGIVVGLWLAQRVRPLVIVTALIAIWTIVQIPPVILASFGSLLVARIILGAAEGPSIAAAAAVVHESFPPDRRSLPTSLVWIGAMLGGIVAPPLLTIMISSYGWKAGFMLCAVLSGLLFSVLLLHLRSSGRQAAPSSQPARSKPTLSAVSGASGTSYWTHPTIITITLVGFCAYWMMSLAFTWMYPMANLHWGYDRTVSGWIVSGVFLLSSITLFGVSALSQALLSKRVEFQWAVILPMVACLVGGSLLLTTSVLLPVGVLKLALFAVAVSLMPVIGATLTIVVSHVAPRDQRNRLLIVLSAVTAFAGLPAPYVTGLLIQRVGPKGYDLAFLCGAGVAFIGGLLALTLLRAKAVRPAEASI